MTPRFLASSCLVLLLTNFVMIGSPAKAGIAPVPTNPFAGRWIDQQNRNISMSVKEDGGIYRISGGDEAYGYNLACLVKNTQAVCSGNGGRLEGQNFLYQSTFSFLPDGSLIESWRAFNNLQTVSGQTTWLHQKPVAR